MRNRFDRQMESLNSQLTHMGELCEVAISRAAMALRNGDSNQAMNVVEADQEIDHMEKDIERLCLRLLLQQQPVARDLRQISAALKMITDMERIGDQASDIAEIIISMITVIQIINILKFLSLSFCITIIIYPSISPSSYIAFTYPFIEALSTLNTSFLNSILEDKDSVFNLILLYIKF